MRKVGRRKEKRQTCLHVTIDVFFKKYTKVLRQIFLWKLKFIAPLTKLFLPFLVKIWKLVSRVHFIKNDTGIN